MANINNREEKKQDLKRRIVDTETSYEVDEKSLRAASKKKKKRRRMVIIILLLLCVIAVLSAWLYMRYGKYTSYEIGWSKDLSRGSLVGYEYYGDNVVKFSRDGASYIGIDGQQNWIESYEMKNPTISVNGDYIAIADQQGTSIEIYSKTGKVGSAKTLLPITKVAVSRQGTVAVLIEDSTASYITFFDRDGTAIDVTVKSILSGDGYPTDISLSPDGTQLMVSYQYLAGTTLSGRVVFYDFSEIGQNIPNRLVGGFDEPFSSSLIGRVRFMNATYSLAAADNGVSFFTSRNLASPEIITTETYEGDIESIMLNENYVGVISQNTTGESRHKIDIYKASGSHVMSKDIDMDYSYADIDGDYIYLIGDQRCMIINMAGVIKYDGEVDASYNKIKATKIPGTYIMTGADAVKQIKFR